MAAATEEQLLRRLARDQWVRLHGTPRITVLVGGLHGQQIWDAWLRVTGRAGTLFGDSDLERSVRLSVARAIELPHEPVAVVAGREALARWRQGRSDRLAAMVDEGWLEIGESTSAEVASSATANPPPDGVGPVASIEIGSAEAAASIANVSSATIGSSHPDALPSTSPSSASRSSNTSNEAASTPFHFDARSVAEAALFEALEATQATRGRFLLNESLSVHFGSRAAEVDLLSRHDRIAIEIDGIHHFADPDCYRRDRRKDLLLQGQGLLVIRVLAEDVMRDPRDAVQVVCQALALRGSMK